nr:PAN2-PAN3 deadenylation complex catalytic subunit Pan2-like isoform X3 [Physcomitrium patens]|eukprot:XP_024386798.1 PAN2-PAN3 deadenylation complex catalytic subunit Pan2-like isoform X3 [Physcomitrella patens]
MVRAKLRELAYVTQQRANEPVCCTLFDPLLDLLWTASSAGSLHSFICPTLDKYSFFGAHPSAVVGLLGAAEGILSVSSEYVRMHTRGGVSLMSFSRDDDVLGITCCDWERPGAGRVLIGHSGSRLSVLDLSTAYIASSVVVGQDIAVMRSNGRLVACGGMGGDIILKDFRTMKTEHTIDAHPGKVSSLDLKGDLLVSCGLTRRMGRIYCEAVIKVFDIRQQARPLSHIPFSPGATILRFQPKFSSIVLATSASGAILLTDVQGVGADVQSYQVDCESDHLLSTDVSSSGELLAFGDSGGYVHVWGASEHDLVNLHSLPTELPDIVQPLAENHVCELESFSDVFLPATTDVPFSAMDMSTPIRVGLPPRIVGKHLLEQMNAHDFVGYVPNPYWRRGSSQGSASRAVAGIRNLRQTPKIDVKPQSTPVQRPGVSVFTTKVTTKSGQSWLPKTYRRVEIKQSQYKLKYEEFDFSYYNKTRFAGLENDIVNSYCNALLQVLYFIPALQAAVTSHVCEREFCLTCELGFVLHMLDVAQGGTCQPSNLLRALRQIKEAAALGLVEGPEEWENSKEKSLAKRIQSFSRFLLEQIHKEGAGSMDPEVPSPLPSISNQLFGMVIHVHSKCRGTSHEDVVQERLSFQVDLQYPAGKPNSVRPSFAELLQNSLCKQEDMRAWCPHCRAYVSLQQTRFPCSLPEILIVNCCIQREADLYYWFADGDYPPTSDSGKTGISNNGSNSTSSGGQVVRSNWLPFRVEIAVDPAASSVTVTEGGTEDSKDVGKSKESVVAESAETTTSTRAVYELTAMVAHVHDEFDKGKLFQEESEGHLVAHIKIPSSYSDSYGGISLSSPGPGVNSSTAFSKLQLEPTPVGLGGASTTSDWVLFNDFCIAPTSASDVVTLYGKQKVPCLLYFSRVKEPVVDSSNHTTQSLPAGSLTIQPSPAGFQGRSHGTPISDEIFKRLILETRASLDSPAAVSNPYTTFLPFDMTTEFPKPRMLLGLDAEFVALAPAEKVRGEGLKAGVCCIDDYICAVEPVYDYLTRYSGVAPGDLDPATSKHPVTTLKKAYVKLRYLVDKGCRFVGHGLKKDFRMINIVVPQAQIIDTVELFHLKRQRMLSLRFLASYLLNTNIQNETHDSIEDACTALRLYEKYKQLVAAGEFHDKLLEIYRYGRKYNWEIVKDVSEESVRADPTPS